MLQRSPTYIVSLPQTNKLSHFLRAWLPATWAYKLIRLQFLILPFLFFKFCKSFPHAARKQLEKGAAAQLPKGYPLHPDFQPSYNPWDQRLCVSPDGDFYQCLREGKSSIVTGNITQVTEKSIRVDTAHGPKVLHPDLIITATGLKLQVGGGARVSVDNEPLAVTRKHIWKGMLMQDVPNAAFVFGYTNASWTLGADATAQFFARLLRKMRDERIAVAVPRADKKRPLGDQTLFNLNSTYVVEGKGSLPLAGDRGPWVPRSWYFRDLFEAKYGGFAEMEFVGARG